MPIQYQWNGFKPPVEADAFGKILEKLQKETNNRVTPQDVLKAGTPKNSPIHDAFDWDDTVAAHKHRLAQASTLLRSIMVVTEDMPDTPVRAMVVVKQEGEDKQSYAPMDFAMKNAGLRSQVLEIALRELNAFKKKYKNLKELAGVFDAIDKVQA